MDRNSIDTPVKKSSIVIKIAALTLMFVLIFVSIYLIRCIPTKKGEFVDSVASQIEQEMDENQFVLSKTGFRRTVADFQEPIILSHGKESRLIVYSANISETITIKDEGLGGWDWTSVSEKVKYEGKAEYTVDLSQLTEEDFVVNNELKSLTVRIPYVVLSPINIPAEKIQISDKQKGWAAPDDVKMSVEEQKELLIQVTNSMKAKLIDDDIMAIANENAKSVVAELLAATVHSIDPGFTVVVVQ